MKDCVHFWVIDQFPSEDKTYRGVCKKCGRRQKFSGCTPVKNHYRHGYARKDEEPVAVFD